MNTRAMSALLAIALILSAEASATAQIPKKTPPVPTTVEAKCEVLKKHIVANGHLLPEKVLRQIREAPTATYVVFIMINDVWGVIDANDKMRQAWGFISRRDVLLPFDTDASSPTVSDVMKTMREQGHL